MTQHSSTERRKTILITGASSGLGMEMARLFAADGHDLALCARRLAPLETLKQELAVHASRIEVRQLDVNDHRQVEHVFEDVVSAFGSIDRVIVNAGVGGGELVGEHGFAANRAIAETNFVAALAQCEAALAIFRRQNAGHLVLISSMSAVRGLPGRLSVYAASKAALAHLGEGLYTELADTPIRVSTILPGYIRTPLNEHVAKMPFEVSLIKGGVALVRAIDREPRIAHVPAWPWSPLSVMLRLAPIGLIKQLSR